jgi:hypothetical protein
MSKLLTVLRWFAILFLLPLALHGAWWLTQDHPASWSRADWSSASLLEPASATPQASVRVFSAPAGRWKGLFSHHAWIVVKEKGASRYTRFDVVGWGSPVRTNGWAPDGRWYGNTPVLVATIDGLEAEKLIPKIRAAVESYQHAQTGDYRVWPGPNSNTFVATVLAAIPEAGIVMPPNAIGRDFRAPFFAGLSPTRTGVQISALGLFGLTIAWQEGIELNVLGLVTGLDIRRLAIKLPGWGLLSFSALSPADQSKSASTRSA